MRLLMWYLYLKLLFGEVYRRIYGRKFSLRRRASGAVNRDFRKYIRRYTSPNENFEYGYSHSYARLQFCFKLERCKPYKAALNLTIFNVINEVKLFLSVANFNVFQWDVVLQNQVH